MLFFRRLRTMPKDMFQWRGYDQYRTHLADIPEGSTTALFYRERGSHDGICKLIGLKRLGARMVNQDFLNQIGALTELVELKLEGLTASDFAPLEGLKKLRLLKIKDVKNIINFNFLNHMPSLELLYIENAKQLSSLDFLAQAHSLRRLGVEGGMYRPQRIVSLAPFGQLPNIEELYLASVQLKDKNLGYLAGCRSLTTLSCARFAPKDEFEKLRVLMPGLACSWFHKYEIL
jgi:hypothetical protein